MHTQRLIHTNAPSRTKQRVRRAATLLPQLLTLTLTLIILSNSVAAFQVSPAAQRLTYAPGTTNAYQLRIINDDKAALNVNLSATGALASDISFDPATFTMTPADAERTVTITVHEPTDPQRSSPATTR